VRRLKVKGIDLSSVFILFNKDNNFALSWSKPNKIPAFRSLNRAETNMKHYQDADHIVEYIPKIKE
jgi:hypothetical protein